MIFSCLLEFLPISSSYCKRKIEKKSEYFVQNLFDHFLSGSAVFFAIISQKGIKCFLSFQIIKNFFFISVPVFLAGLFYLWMKNNPHHPDEICQNNDEYSIYCYATLLLLCATFYAFLFPEKGNGFFLSLFFQSIILTQINTFFFVKNFFFHLNKIKLLFRVMLLIVIALLFQQEKLIYFYPLLLYCLKKLTKSTKTFFLLMIMILSSNWSLIMQTIHSSFFTTPLSPDYSFYYSLGLLQAIAGVFSGWSRLGLTVSFFLLNGFFLKESYFLSFYYSLPVLIGPLIVLSMIQKNKIRALLAEIPLKKILGSFSIQFLFFIILLWYRDLSFVLYVGGLFYRLFFVSQLWLKTKPHGLFL